MSITLIDQLNTEQRQAVTHRGRPLRIIAGAGTGKTATLTARFVDLVTNGDAAIDQILALTYTRKAAEEMRTRIVQALDRSYAGHWISTFHSFCQRALREELARRRLPAPQIIEQDERLLHLGVALEGLSFKTYGNDRQELYRQALLFIDRVKDECLSPSDAHELAEHLGSIQVRELAMAYERYQERLREQGEFDFGELQLRFIEYLEEDSGALTRWRKRFKHILIDEYQDVNRAQARIIELLAGDGENLTVVGDTDQAIYAFRGASHRFLDEMEQTYPSTETIILNTNYRSHQPILDAANALIVHNPRDDDARSRLAAHDGRAGPKPIVYRAESELDEAEWIAREIARLHWNEGVDYGDIAVLVRSVMIAGGAIAQAIRDYDVPVVFSGRDYQETRAIADVAATLRLLQAETPDALCHVLAAYEVDPLLLIRARAQGPSENQNWIDEWTANDPLARRAVRTVRERLEVLRDASLPEQIYGALSVCNRLPPPDEPGQADIAYMRAFRRILERGTRHAERGGDLPAYLAILDAALDEQAYESEPAESAVQLMTVHAAKGLEFKYVFVAGLTDGRFPLIRRLDRGLDLQDPASWRLEDAGKPDGDRAQAFLEEERRLGYVALTRAQERLYLSYAQAYKASDETRPTFILNIDAGEPGALVHIDHESERPAWSATEYARIQRERLTRALHSSAITGEAIGDLLLSQWTLPQLPDATTWTPPVSPVAFNGDEQLRLSYSALRVWEECHRKYYYSNVLRLEDEKPGPQLGLGRAIHDTIEWMNRERKDGRMPSEDELITYFRENWDPEGFEAPAQERQNRERGEALLRRFYRWESRQQREVLETELTFGIPFGRHVLTGRIDAVVRNADGTVEIIDYKSGKKSQQNRSRRVDAIPQLAIYRIAWEELHPGETPRTSVYYLRHQNDKGLTYEPEFKFNAQSWALDLKPEEIDDVRARLASFADGVLSNQFFVTDDPRTCERCPYAAICEGADVDDG